MGDISGVAEAASQGVTHVVAKSDCFENLHWFSTASGLSIDPAEWELLKTILELLKPASYPVVPIDVEAQVGSLCFLSCTGQWDVAKCGGLPVTMTTTAQPVPQVEALGPPLSSDRLQKFFEAFSDRSTAPWLFLFLAVAFFIGVTFAFFFSYSFKEPAARLVPRRVKQVEVAYPDGATMSTSMMR